MRRLLPTILATLTGHSRQQVIAGRDFQWSSQSWVHNAFRVYELIFWRRVGIRPETSVRHIDGKTIVAFHSWEAVLAQAEVFLRSLSRLSLPYKIWIPVLQLATGLPVFSSPYLFAIAIDTSVKSTSSSWSHTITGSNTLINIEGNSLNDTITGSTYNSVTAPLANKTTFPGSGRLGAYMFLLPGAATGANTVALAGTGIVGGASTSYSGAKQTSQPDSSAVNNSGANPLTASTTVVASGCWLIGNYISDNAGGAGTGTTVRQTDGATTGLTICDSNGTVSTGSQSLSITGSVTSAMVVASIAPAGGGAAVVHSLMSMGIGG